MSNLDKQIEQLKRCEYIKESEVKELCNMARELLIEESNVLHIDTPITVNTSNRYVATYMVNSGICRSSLK